MPVVTVRAGRKCTAKLDTLVRKVTEAASGLLESNDRVLVVYGKETASIYYDAEAVAAPTLPRAS
jgi:phenylpyruvate tautomerase PptA (4-oxalocrotonate tautomerase family)